MSAMFVMALNFITDLIGENRVCTSSSASASDLLIILSLSYTHHVTSNSIVRVATFQLKV